jgi:hypothetical protein
MLNASQTSKYTFIRAHSDAARDQNTMLELHDGAGPIRFKTSKYTSIAVDAAQGKPYPP